MGNREEMRGMTKRIDFARLRELDGMNARRFLLENLKEKEEAVEIYYDFYKESGQLKMERSSWMMIILYRMLFILWFISMCANQITKTRIAKFSFAEILQNILIYNLSTGRLGKKKDTLAYSFWRLIWYISIVLSGAFFISYLFHSLKMNSPTFLFLWVSVPLLPFSIIAFESLMVLFATKTCHMNYQVNHLFLIFYFLLFYYFIYYFIFYYFIIFFILYFNILFYFLFYFLFFIFIFYFILIFFIYYFIYFLIFCFFIEFILFIFYFIYFLIFWIYFITENRRF